MSSLTGETSLNDIRKLLATKGAIADPLCPSDYAPILLIITQREQDYVADLYRRQRACIDSAVFIKAKFVDGKTYDEDISRFDLRTESEQSEKATESKKRTTSTFRMGVRQSSQQ